MTHRGSTRLTDGSSESGTHVSDPTDLDTGSKRLVTHWILLAITVLWPFAPATLRGDWPEYRGDLQRTSFRQQKLESKFWKPNWSYAGLSAPSPAWPKPARGSLWQNLTYIEARVVDDQASVPLIGLDEQGESHVLIASSSNDRLISLDPKTGKTEWQFVTGAPIRYAPSIERGIAFFGSDDGWVRAVRVGTGELIWQTRVGPGLPWIVGNGRLISPHPIRTSVIVSGDLVYAHAGLFPSQGVYSVALDRRTGVVSWRRKIEKSPQGYLLATGDDRVYVPTGRSVPYAIQANNGKIVYELPSAGGSFCMLTADAFFTGPGNSARIESFAAKNRAKMLSFSGRQIAAGNGTIWTANGAKLAAHDMARVMKGDKNANTWTVDCKLNQGLLVTGTKESRFAFVAGGSQVEVFDANRGRLLSSFATRHPEEEIVYLAVSAATRTRPEIVVASTRSGKIYCWEGSHEQAGDSWPKPDQQAEAPADVGIDKLDRVKKIESMLKSDAGFALVANAQNGEYTRLLVSRTRLHVVCVAADEEVAESLRELFYRGGLYGHRVTVLHLPDERPIPFAAELFNLVLVEDSSKRRPDELKKLLWPGTGVLSLPGSEPVYQPKKEGVGSWRHQYANPSNHSDSRDQFVGQAAAFRLQWFGGVGPSRMPDRHVRGPAPLAAGSSMVLQADGGLIGVDPANGTERWHLELPPETTRYVTPFDGGYASLDENGEQLFIATRQKILNVNAVDGTVRKEIALPRIQEKASYRWGYLVEANGSIYASCMKTSAPRVATERPTQKTYVADDYKSNRPLVTSRELFRFDHSGRPLWQYSPKGIIPNGSISLDPASKRIVFIEGRSQSCVDHKTDRVAVPEIVKDAHLVCLDSETGKRVWEKPLPWPQATNVLFTQIIGQHVSLATSESISGKAHYHLKVVSLADGKEVWSDKHPHIKSGLGHGEQVHHPVALRQNDGQIVLVAEPYFYELKTGKRVVPSGAEADWGIQRPGHSCGTLSAAGNCLFFRANNPTVLNLNAPRGGTFTKLAPSRPGCWINIIPVGGRLLIPEASASCVCKYSLQTSMSFVPIKAEDLKTQFTTLDDIEPKAEKR